jgi:hypothetical protein
MLQHWRQEECLSNAVDESMAGERDSAKKSDAKSEKLSAGTGASSSADVRAAFAVLMTSLLVFAI